MAHIVCITGGLAGIFNASLALVEQLLAVGHRVTYASPAGSPADTSEVLAAQGVPFVQLDSWVIQSGDPPMGRWAKFREVRSRQERAVRALGTENFVETIRALAPDLVLIDIEMHPHIMAAVMGGLPVGLLCPSISIWKRSGLPPISSKTVPGETWWSRWLGLELSWAGYAFGEWLSSQRERWRRMGLDRISVVRCYGESINYPFRENFGSPQWLVPYPHGDLPILCLNALELDFPHDPHSSMQYLGPMISKSRLTVRMDTERERALAELFNRRKREKRTLVYCGCSSYRQGNKDFLRRVIAAVALEPDWDLVIGLGGRFLPDELGSLPENVYAFWWIPQLRVLAEADCAIVNSGPHSITECVHFGVPMLVYSLAHACQNGNAARVKYHGLGIVGDLEKDGPAEIRVSIRLLLNESRYRERVNAMRLRCQRYTDENIAAASVEALLPPHPLPPSLFRGKGLGDGGDRISRHFSYQKPKGRRTSDETAVMEIGEVRDDAEY